MEKIIILADCKVDSYERCSIENCNNCNNGLVAWEGTWRVTISNLPQKPGQVRKINGTVLFEDLSGNVLFHANVQHFRIDGIEKDMCKNVKTYYGHINEYNMEAITKACQQAANYSWDFGFSNIAHST